MASASNSFEVTDLCVELPLDGARKRVSTRTAQLLDGLAFAPAAGLTTAVVGESGCGKTMLALALMGLIDQPLSVSRGVLTYAGEDFAMAEPGAFRSLRGKHFAMVFQEPMSALNPIFTIGDQIVEAINAHARLGRAARTLAIDWLARVGLPEPARAFSQYPHELSGGMKQRAMIAMALAPAPAVLIADEPTTALDATVQRQILNLLASLQTELGLTTVLITHDLSVVAEYAQGVAIMYAGRLVESANSAQLFASPQHPYTRALLECMPSAARRGVPLATIPGTVPMIDALPPGCRFAPRCGHAFSACNEAPGVSVQAPDQRVYCWRYSA